MRYDGDLRIKIITSDGEFTFGGDKCPITDYDGFYAPEYEVKLTSYASCDGGYPSVRRYGERVLTIDAELSMGDVERLVPMLRISDECVLEVISHGRVRRTGVIPYGGIKAVSCGDADILSCELSFIAPDVFFEGESETFAGDNGTVEAENTGDVPCGITMTLEAVGGDTASPAVSYGTEYVKCPLTLHDGERIIIDTRIGHKKITVNGERYLRFDSGSTFFSVPAGKSTIKAEAESGAEHISFGVSLTPLYFGI